MMMMMVLVVVVMKVKECWSHGATQRHTHAHTHTHTHTWYAVLAAQSEAGVKFPVNTRCVGTAFSFDPVSNGSVTTTLTAALASAGRRVTYCSCHVCV